jgi:hypothetical protein
MQSFAVSWDDVSGVSVGLSHRTVRGVDILSFRETDQFHLLWFWLFVRFLDVCLYNFCLYNFCLYNFCLYNFCLYNFCLYDFAHHITTKVVGYATARRRATRLYLFALGSCRTSRFGGTRGKHVFAFLHSRSAAIFDIFWALREDLIMSLRCQIPSRRLRQLELAASLPSFPPRLYGVIYLPQILKLTLGQALHW